MKLKLAHLNDEEKLQIERLNLDEDLFRCCDIIKMTYNKIPAESRSFKTNKEINTESKALLKEFKDKNPLISKEDYIKNKVEEEALSTNYVIDNISKLNKEYSKYKKELQENIKNFPIDYNKKINESLNIEKSYMNFFKSTGIYYNFMNLFAFKILEELVIKKANEHLLELGEDLEYDCQKEEYAEFQALIKEYQTIENTFDWYFNSRITLEEALKETEYNIEHSRDDVFKQYVKRKEDLIKIGAKYHESH